jgi:hypothetical protein
MKCFRKSRSKNKQSHPKINSIEVWTDAFMVALSVFGSALPETFHELLKHMYLITGAIL